MFDVTLTITWRTRHVPAKTVRRGRKLVTGPAQDRLTLHEIDRKDSGAAERHARRLLQATFPGRIARLTKPTIRTHRAAWGC